MGKIDQEVIIMIVAIILITLFGIGCIYAFIMFYITIANLIINGLIEITNIIF